MSADAHSQAASPTEAHFAIADAVSNYLFTGHHWTSVGKLKIAHLIAASEQALRAELAKACADVVTLTSALEQNVDAHEKAVEELARLREDRRALVAKVSAIAGDFIPSHDREIPQAFQEMRDALETLVAEQQGADSPANP